MDPTPRGKPSAPALPRFSGLRPGKLAQAPSASWLSHCFVVCGSTALRPAARPRPQVLGFAVGSRDTRVYDCHAGSSSRALKSENPVPVAPCLTPGKRALWARPSLANQLQDQTSLSLSQARPHACWNGGFSPPSFIPRGPSGNEEPASALTQGLSCPRTRDGPFTFPLSV